MRGAWWRGRAARRGAGALAVLAALLTLRLPRTARLDADFPQHSPAHLAHFLADFTNHPKLYPHLSGSWWIEDEWNNYTMWRYAVGYECGERCAGRATLEHRAGAAHRLLLSDQRCQHLPWLPWPSFCEYSETETEITARGGGGARLREETRERCGAAALLRGCAPAERRRRHLRALRRALAAD
ncbi:unnamed protein product, partial [Brenthis ino]